MKERLTESFEKRQVRANPDRWKHFGHKALSAVTIGSSIITPINILSIENINENIEAVENGRIDVSVILEAIDQSNNDKAVVFINGFNTNDADKMSRDLGPGYQQYIQDAQVLSLSYGNAPLSTQGIAEEIVQMTIDMNINEVSLMGYSGGGNIAHDVNRLIRRMSDVEIPYTLNISTANGLDGLRDATKEQIEFYSEVISHFPMLVYYDPARIIGELMIRQSHFTNDDGGYDPEKFFKVLGDINDDINDPDYAKTSLAYDQLQAIENIDIQEAINESAEQGQYGLQTVYGYIGTGKGGYDYVVNDKKSGKEICGYAEEAGVHCVIQNTPNAVHTMPQLTIEEYNQTFKQMGEVLQSLAAQERRVFEQRNHPITQSDLPIAIQ